MPRPKYNNKKVVIDDIKFDSKLEAEYYRYLKKEREKGLLTFEMQVPLLLIPSFKSRGKTFRKAVYKADFKVIYAGGSIEYQDTKGLETDTFKLKRKLLEYTYPDIYFYLIKKEGSKWKKYR